MSSPGPWRWVRKPPSKYEDTVRMSGLEDSTGARVIDSEKYTDEYGVEVATEEDAKLIAKAPEMAALLRELEWWGESEHWQGVYACLFCNGDQPGERHPGGPTGHSPDCRLAALLKELP